MGLKKNEIMKKQRLRLLIIMLSAALLLSGCKAGGQTDAQSTLGPVQSSAVYPWPRTNLNTPSTMPPPSPGASSEPKPHVEAKDFYTKNKPTLMGLSLNESKDTVIFKFGPVHKQWVMDADADPVTVWMYTDFSIGFNNKDELVFVEVHSKDIDPGLGGLKLGQGADTAYQALGKPTNSTSTTLMYKSQGTVLKIDVDPKQNEVLGIHFFKSVS
jgi:hypothetical protein